MSLFSENPGGKKVHGEVNRRQFLAGAGTVATAFSIMKPQLVRGSQVSSKISIGVIGNGNRGSWIAGLFQKHVMTSIANPRLPSGTEIVCLGVTRRRTRLWLSEFHVFIMPSTAPIIAAAKVK